MTIFPFLKMRFINLSVLLGGVLLLSACQQESTDKKFRFVPASQSGIAFSNDIQTNDSFNILNFHYIYNGGGVGVGDFDKNGLPDLVFSGNQVPSKLYLNQGNLQFKDISKAANFQTERWATGVSIVDINADGWEDIYISVGGLNCEDGCPNYLFINQGLNGKGLLTFKEMAVAYGLTDELYTQQAAFFDYDNDGDLDVYLLHNAITLRDKNAPNPKRFISEASQDILLENIGEKDGIPAFKDVSTKNNITNRGYGLGITINDFNVDGRPDIYVANDFLSEDLLYLNTPNDGFQEVSKQYLKHTSYNAMGVDVADINNDGLPEIMVLDMLPETQERRKSMQGFMNYNKFALSLRRDYMPQFIRNTLQLHNGFLGDELLPFSDVGYMAGVYNTDWSWVPLLADFDNDGDRDIYITNGYGKDITDLDFINYSQNLSQFGTKAALEQKLAEVVDQMKNVEIPNYFFENEGNLSFKNQSKNWTREKNSISNGAVYADLDNDGDLDIITNNINQAAFVLENRTEGNNYLKIQLKGQLANHSGIGIRVDLIKEEVILQRRFQEPIRGYLSSVEPVLHFGLGQEAFVHELRITWKEKVAENFVQFSKRLYNIDANQKIIVDISEDKVVMEIPEMEFDEGYFEETTLMGLHFKHRENYYQDYDFQPLLLKQLSKQGPCLAVANVDGKKGDELFIGGAKGIAGKIYSQQKNGQYTFQSLPDSMSEDTDAIFFDVDKDGDLDLYVVSGGTEFAPTDPNLQDRVYVNDGQGHFTKSEQYQSPVKNSGSVVIATKPDKYGDSFVFVGGRIIPGKYPNIPNSVLMTNHYDNLSQNTDKFAHGLYRIGMVTDALFTDYNSDSKEDLIALTEWGNLVFYKNKGGLFDKEAVEIFMDKDTTQIIRPSGFWSSIKGGDFDNDGDTDYLLGNLGENTNLKATIAEPLFLYKGDFDKNGGTDPLVGHYYTTKKGERKNFPLHARDDVVKQLVKVKSRYRTYAEFGEATLSEILPNTDLEKDYLQVNYLKSSYLENKGNGRFILRPLPKLAQLAPIQAFLVEDFD